MSDPVRKRIGLAGTGARDDQQRAGVMEVGTAIFDGVALLGIELCKVRGRGGRRLWRSRQSHEAVLPLIRPCIRTRTGHERNFKSIESRAFSRGSSHSED